MAKRFGPLEAVSDVNLRVEQGSVAALLGPSGSGKTTVLRLLAGFETPDSGTVRIGGRTVAGPGAWVEPEDRRVGMLFQDGALFPHLDVARNVAFGAMERRRARECLELVGLEQRAAAFPHELSGGERQRVALARALAADPEIVLLDEPFAALDPSLRERLREDVVSILRAAGTTALFVTHDQGEALSVADHLALLRAGRLEQVGTPEEIYSRPESRWAAEFLGEANLLPGQVRDGVVECELGRFEVGDGLSGQVLVVVRPEALTFGRGAEINGLEGVVLERSFFGHDQLLHVRLPSGLRLRCRLLGPGGPAPGDRVPLGVAGHVSALPETHESGGTAR